MTKRKEERLGVNPINISLRPSDAFFDDNLQWQPRESSSPPPNTFPVIHATTGIFDSSIVEII